MQKSPLQYGKIIFQSKVIPLFLPECSNFHHSEMYTIYGILYTLYGRDCRGKKPDKTWRNEVKTKTVKIATSKSFISQY